MSERTNVRTKILPMQNDSMIAIKEVLEQRKNILLKGADLLSQKGFTQVPNYVLESKKVSPGLN